MLSKFGADVKSFHGILNTELDQQIHSIIYQLQDKTLKPKQLLKDQNGSFSVYYHSPISKQEKKILSYSKKRNNIYIGQGCLQMSIEGIIDTILTKDTVYKKNKHHMHEKNPSITVFSEDDSCNESIFKALNERRISTSSFSHPKRKLSEIMKNSKSSIESNLKGRVYRYVDMGVTSYGMHKGIQVQCMSNGGTNCPISVWTFLPNQQNHLFSDVYYFEFHHQLESSMLHSFVDFKKHNARRMLSEMTCMDKLLKTQCIKQYYYTHTDKWKPNFMGKNCNVCSKRMFLRLRHHCRICGDICCHDCCKKILIDLPIFDSKYTRICTSCLNSSVQFRSKREIRTSSISSSDDLLELEKKFLKTEQCFQEFS